MNDSAVSNMESAEEGRADQGRADEKPAGAGWLLLIHQIPAEPAYLRVKTLRRLRALGSVALKSSVYVLPDKSSTREDFHWLRREILDGGGEATLVVCQFLQGTSDRELAELFRAERNEEYAELVEAVSHTQGTSAGTQGTSAGTQGTSAGTQRTSAGRPGRSELNRFRRRLERIRERDHFRAPGRAAAEHAIRGLEADFHGEVRKERAKMEPRPRGATWVTRQDVYVDRMASGWLIRRFIDPEATFKFVPSDGYEPRQGELRFDMYEGEFTHEGERCTFETLVLRFDLDQAGLVPIAEIVHEIDCKDEKYGRPETLGVASVLGGIASVHQDDAERMAAAAPVFEGLFERFRSTGS